MSSETFKFAQSPRVLTRVVGDEVIIAVPEHDEVMVLSATGKAIWELIETPVTTSSVIGTLAGLYECPEDEISGDVESFLSNLLEKRVVDRYV